MAMFSTPPHPHLDYSQHIALSVAQFNAGWQAPKDGIVHIAFVMQNASANATVYFGVNRVGTCFAWPSSGGVSFMTDTVLFVSAGDTVGVTSTSKIASTLAFSCQFIPYK